MLKYKVIGAFVVVWCAVCLMYVGVRTALGALLDRTTQVEATSETIDEIALPKLEVDSTPIPIATPEPEAESEPAPVPEPADKTESGSGSESETTGTTDDLLNKIEDRAQETEALETPSLAEYLSWYTCGSCRRNCSLANPRCHNGSHLAQQKAQEYYELYG